MNKTDKIYTVKLRFILFRNFEKKFNSIIHGQWSKNLKICFLDI